MTMLKGVRQVIWGSFKGYSSPSSPSPWIEIIAFDSTWFEIRTDDAGVLDIIRSRFKDVKEC